MARIEWVRERLHRWAAWRNRRDSGSQGYPTQAAFTKLVVDKSGFSDGGLLSVDDAEASETEQAVQSMRAGRPHLLRTLELIYLEDVGIRRAAVQLHCAESTVKARLEQADHEIQAWLRAKADERARAKAAGSFTP
jgi:DNA-directed RNA polymerase specialized sigma24 family protein